MARKEREKRSWAVKVIKRWVRTEYQWSQKSWALVIGGCSRFIKGFITRNQPLCTDNSEYLAYVRHSYLTRLRENLPKTVLEKDSWLTPPPIMQEVRHSYQALIHEEKVGDFFCDAKLVLLKASQLLKKLYIRHMVRKYVGEVTPQRKAQVLLQAPEQFTIRFNLRWS